MGLFDDPKALARAVDVLNFDAFTSKSLVLSFPLFGQLPISRFFVRNLTSGMRLRNPYVT